jgi:hypothetical protein
MWPLPVYFAETFFYDAAIIAYDENSEIGYFGVTH